MTPQKRCINIDWLECYCLEDLQQPLSIENLLHAGWDVEQRDYGTRIYNEMWKLKDHFGNDVLEVRRSPKSVGSTNSIMPINACHIRLSNRACYASNAIDIMRGFIAANMLTFVKIYRIDLCLDFERFDSGDDPRKFLLRYLKNKYAKINQSEGNGHFKDNWSYKEWNSLSWGKKKSPIRTKIYLKTKEIAEVHDKPYIWQAWMQAGLIDNPLSHEKVGKDGVCYQPDIWRLEFSVMSDVKNWVRIEVNGEEKHYHSIRNTLEMYDSPGKMLSMFASLQQHYFRFVKYRMGKNKYECPDKILFKWTTNEDFYKVEHPSTNAPVITENERLRRYLEKYRDTHIAEELRKAVNVILEAIEREDAGRFCLNRFSSAEIEALRLTIAQRLAGSDKDPALLYTQLIQTIKESPSLF